MKNHSLPALLGSRMPGSVRGFTLVEMMVVIAILGIALAIAAPSFSRIIAEQRLRGVASELHNALLFARSAAITRNESVVIAPASDDDWTSGWTIYLASDEDTVLRTDSAFTGATLSGTPNSITFSAVGRADAISSITLTSDADSTVQRCVSIDVSGRPATTKGGC
jgi:type IV fimbrial biogenesis protein FimT